MLVHKLESLHINADTTTKGLKQLAVHLGAWREKEGVGMMARHERSMSRQAWWWGSGEGEGRGRGIGRGTISVLVLAYIRVKVISFCSEKDLVDGCSLGDENNARVDRGLQIPC